MIGPWPCPSQLFALTNYSASHIYWNGTTVSYDFYFGIGNFVASPSPIIGRYNFGTLTSVTSSLVRLANAHIKAHCQKYTLTWPGFTEVVIEIIDDGVGGDLILPFEEEETTCYTDEGCGEGGGGGGGEGGGGGGGGGGQLWKTCVYTVYRNVWGDEVGRTLDYCYYWTM